MKIKSLLGAISLSLAFSPSINAETIIPADAMDFAQLGMPYNTHTKEIHNFICVNAEIDNQVGTPTAQFNFEHNMSYRKTMEALSGSLSAGVDYPMVKLGANAHIVNEYIKDEYSSSWTAYAVAVPDVIRLNPGINGYQLSGKCQEYSNLYTLDAENMMKKAGDEFISQINLGASILVQMRLKFANRFQKDAWDANAKFSDTSSWKLQIEGYLNSLSEKEKSSISIEIKAFQNGGVPGQLASVMPSNILSCSVSDIAACESAFEDALAYINNFGDQLNDPRNYNVLSFTTSSYSESGLFQMVPPNSNLEPLNAVYLDQLDSQFEQQLNDRNRSITMIGEYSRYLGSDWKNELNLIKRKTDQNAYMVTKVADICYRFPYGNECRDQYSALMEGENKLIKDYDRKYLYLPPVTVKLTFNGIEYSFTGEQAKFGENAKVANLTPASDILVEEGSSNPFGMDLTYTDNCELYVDHLSSSASQLTFTESDTYDLGPLYTPELENSLFENSSPNFTGKLFCKGLGSDLVVNIPLKAKLPVSQLNLNLNGKWVNMVGSAGEYLPSLQTSLHPTSPLTFNIKDNPRIYYNLKNTNSCTVSLDGFESNSTVNITKSGGNFLIRNLITDSIQQRIESERLTSLTFKADCYGLGGDLSYYIPVSVDHPTDILNVSSFKMTGYRPDTDYEWFYYFRVEVHGADSCHVDVNVTNSNGSTSTFRRALGYVDGIKSFKYEDMAVPTREYDIPNRVPAGQYPKATLTCNGSNSQTDSKTYQTTINDWSTGF